MPDNVVPFETMGVPLPIGSSSTVKPSEESLRASVPVEEPPSWLRYMEPEFTEQLSAHLRRAVANSIRENEGK